MNIAKTLLAACALSIGLASAATAAPLPAGHKAWMDVSFGDVQAKYKNPDYRLAAKYYARAAAQGDMWGQQKLGELYEKGKGVPKNEAKAAALFKQSASQGNPWGHYNYARLLLTGKGVKKNVPMAVRLLRGAESKTHNQWVRLNLGIALKDTSPAEARKFLRLAAADGNKLAAQELATLR